MKRMVSCFLIVAMALCIITTATAHDDIKYSAMSDDDLSIMTGIAKDEISEAREFYGNDFDEVMSEYVEVSSVTPMGFSPMGDYDWNRLKETFSGGVIIVSKDQSTVLRHGHAAICFTSTHIVEHPGTGQLSRLIAADQSFKNLGAVATFKPTGATNSQMLRAGNYACNNLLDWEYNVLASRTSSTKMNCATLVWKSYDYVDVEVCDPGTGTVYPSMLDVDGYTTQLYATGQYVGASWVFSAGEVTE